MKTLFGRLLAMVGAHEGQEKVAHNQTSFHRWGVQQEIVL